MLKSRHHSFAAASSNAGAASASAKWCDIGMIPICPGTVISTVPEYAGSLARTVPLQLLRAGRNKVDRRPATKLGRTTAGQQKQIP